MAGVNKVILVGNLGDDPEARSLNNGGEVVNLRVATSENWKDNDGNRQERTEWHNVVIFNENLGRVAKSYLRKGSKVYLEGQIQTRKWTDQTGNDRYTTEIVLQSFRGELLLLDSRDGGGGSRGAFNEDFGGDDFGGGGGRASPIASAAGGVRHRPRRRRSVLGASSSFRQLWRGPRTGLLRSSRHHAGFPQRGLGGGAARIRVEAERQRVGDRAAQVDRAAVVEHHVAILGAKLDLFLGPPAAARARTESRTARRYGRRPARR